MTDQTDPTPPENPEPTPPEPGEGERTYTQAEMDAEAAKIRRSYQTKYGDYGDLRKKAELWEQHESEQQSELEKLQGQLAEAQSATNAANAERDGALIRNAVLVEAAKQGIPQDRLEAALRLIDLNSLNIDEGEVDGVEEAVKSMLTANPFLLGDQPSAPSLDSGAGGGTRPGKGIRLTPLQQHLAKVSGMTEEAYAEYLSKQAERSQESIPPNFLRSSEDG